MDTLMEILGEMRPDINFAEETQLVTEGLFDSVDIISLVASISDEFDVKIKPAHLVPENFNSAEAIWNLIQELQED